MLKRNRSYTQPEVQQFLVENLPQWKNVDPNHIQLTRLTGLTNITFKAELEHSKIVPQAVIFREFGHAEGFIDQKLEKIVFSTISGLGIGPKEYACGGTWRIEEFITDAMHPDNQLLADQDFQFKCMGVMQRFHNIDMPDLDRTKSTIVQTVLSEQMRCSVLGKIGMSDLYSDEESMKLELVKSSLTDQEELDFLRDMVEKENQEKLAFCHNDLNQLNLFKTFKGDREIIYIDYEYCSYNYPSFDIANFLNESAINYQYPQAPFYELVEKHQFNNVQVRYLALCYLLHAKCTNNEIKLLNALANQIQDVNKDKDSLRNFQKEAEQLLRERCPEEEIVALYNEVKYMARRIRRFQILSNLNWVYWSVLQAKNDIDFEHIQYSMVRLYMYNKLLREERKRAGKASLNASSLKSTDSSDDL